MLLPRRSVAVSVKLTEAPLLIKPAGGTSIRMMQLYWHLTVARACALSCDMSPRGLACDVLCRKLSIIMCMHSVVRAVN